MPGFVGYVYLERRENRILSVCCRLNGLFTGGAATSSGAANHRGFRAIIWLEGATRGIFWHTGTPTWGHDEILGVRSGTGDLKDVNWLPVSPTSNDA
uniref:Uncharacterized protein n=1 Tax=Hyaloperonospora arabidopsidis (strain Emoy2) TaxID=559515 RepID=M4BG51_HYAAE